MQSVLQNWVMELPLRAQGTLMTSMRSCDVAPKHPPCVDERFGCSTGESTPERELHAFLRWCVMVPADPREIDIPGAWFKSQPPTDWKPSQFGHYPLHWQTHLFHCYEVVGYCHPDEQVRRKAFNVYERFVRALHLNVETKEQMFERLTEDRIASGEVVS